MKTDIVGYSKVQIEHAKQIFKLMDKKMITISGPTDMCQGFSELSWISEKPMSYISEKPMSWISENRCWLNIFIKSNDQMYTSYQHLIVSLYWWSRKTSI